MTSINKVSSPAHKVSAHTKGKKVSPDPDATPSKKSELGEGVDVKLSQQAKRQGASANRPEPTKSSDMENMDDLVDFYANKLRRAAKRLERKEKLELSQKAEELQDSEKTPDLAPKTTEGPKQTEEKSEAKIEADAPKMSSAKDS